VSFAALCNKQRDIEPACKAAAFESKGTAYIKQLCKVD
jgi:hypothetical protein